MKPAFLPESFLNKIAPEDRRAIGRLARTASERQTDIDVRLERELHKLIWNELLRRNIVPIHSRTDRKATIGTGLPDFCFALNSYPVAMEVKLPCRKLTEEQDAIRIRMEANGWIYAVVHSFDEARSVLAGVETGRIIT